jgi:predicted nucleotide-binding protein
MLLTAEESRGYLTQRRVQFKETIVPHGIQFRCGSGEIFTVFKTGRVSVQGRQSDLAQAVSRWADSGAAPVAVPTEPQREIVAPAQMMGPDKRVFIVYGHDIGARDNLELLIRRMGLEPIVLQNLPATGDTIIEKLERYLGENENVGFACVLLTPDDEGHKVGKVEEKKYRARQNVVLELGMVLARLGRRRVAILFKESVEHPSDIAGLIYIPFQERVDEVRAQLFRELQAAGYTPRTDAL